MLARRQPLSRPSSNAPTATAESSGRRADCPDRGGARRLPEVRQIREINGGIYAFDLAPLFDALRGIASQNAQGEYHLTDLVAIYRRRRLPVETLVVDNP